MRREFFIAVGFSIIVILAGYLILPPIYYPIHSLVSVFLAIIGFIGIRDAFQTRRAILRNFPVLGNFRYLLEMIRPEINQYFIESNTDGRPFHRNDRSVVYQRAKKQLDSLPFGTQLDVNEIGYEWLNHSIMPKHFGLDKMRVTIGGPDCKQPYSASMLNISAMSYGSLSKNAIQALNGGAQKGNFAHNTGEGSISDHHLKHGGDLIWQIGTGYFGCRTSDGKFNPETFKERSQLTQVKMIELKISQGAKPGHGGILPGKKVTEEIAKIRDVPVGQTVNSPPGHSAFSTPEELLQFIKQMRDLSGGKPVGFKLCLGRRREFMSICKAMVKTGIKPDFIAVDGGEGGTGAAPMEFSDRLGQPGIDSLIFVDNALRGFDLRKDIRVIASGKVVTGFGIVKRLALGADLCYAARSMMMALGCIQALRCNANDCPTGVATTNPFLVAGLVVTNKIDRVFNYHKETLESAAHMIGAMGIEDPHNLRPWQVFRRVGHAEIRNFSELYPQVEVGQFLKGDIPDLFKFSYNASHPETFNTSV